MKYVILVGDGMADWKIESLGNKTPLQHCKTPNMDLIASRGEVGLFKSVPEGYPPGSDVCNLSILGYDPRDCYTGRSPLEAASMNVELEEKDMAFRANLVRIKEEDDIDVMDDYSGGHISTEEAVELIKALQDDPKLKEEGVRFHPGVAYRHLMVYPGCSDEGLHTTPPHDISDKDIEEHYPRGVEHDKLKRLMIISREILNSHPVNEKRVSEGKKPANSIWLWGEGFAPKMEKFEDKHGLKGSLISAVDLMKGIAIYAGLESIDVPGATGYVETNYRGKAEYALDSLKNGKDFILVHVEAPDEAGHSGSLEDKITAIERFDDEVVGTILKGLEEIGDYKVIVLPDHPTPIEIKTHTSDPVPFAVFDSRNPKNSGAIYDEDSAKASDIFIENPTDFINEFIK